MFLEVNPELQRAFTAQLTLIHGTVSQAVSEGMQTVALNAIGPGCDAVSQRSGSWVSNRNLQSYSTAQDGFQKYHDGARTVSMIADSYENSDLTGGAEITGAGNGIQLA
jgi:hypothetical protein